MYCKSCGRKLNPGELFCADCGSRVEAQVNNMNQSVITPNGQMIPKKNSGKKVVIIIILAFILLLGAVALFFMVIFKNITKAVESSDRIVCEAGKGKITIMYDETGITGYTAVQFGYDKEGQKEIAEIIGMEAYIIQFNEWFKENSSGSCVIKLKDGTEKEIASVSEGMATKVVGSEEYGFVEVPENWGRFIDTAGASALQYSYANIYIVSLDQIDANGYTAEDYASTFMTNQENEPSVTGVTGSKVQIGKNNEYLAYQVYMYYPNEDVYLITYWFETGDGKIRYIALEGPEKLGNIGITDLLSIPNSFSLTSGM